MLRWNHKWGKTLDVWIRAIKEEGRTPQPELLKWPSVAPHLEPHWLAFHELGSERHNGMGMAPIPFFAIERYVKTEMGLYGDAAETAAAIIRATDEGFLVMMNEAAEKNRSQPAADKGRTFRPVGGENSG